MKIVICGSMQFEPKMAQVATELESKGYEVDKPNVVEGHVYEDNLDANSELKRGFIDEHFAKIDAGEAILVVNEAKNGIDNYIGGNTLIEMAHAYSQGLEVFLLNPVPEVSYADEIRGMHPIVLGGSLDNLDEYVATLPIVVMSTTSHPKQLAVSRAMRRFGVPVQVTGQKVPSGVSEQPMTIAETYEGAMNRHKHLIDSGVQADYFCTIESGFEELHQDHGLYGCSVLIFNKVNEPVEVGFEVDLEFPSEIFDEVPSKYADVGVLIQEKYQSPHKDAYPFLTSGRLYRAQILENALFNVLVKNKKLGKEA